MTSNILTVVIEKNEGGIYKRISENREVLQAILEKAPELISKEPAILDWIKDTDKFLHLLADVIPHNPENCSYPPSILRQHFRVNSKFVDFETAGKDIKPHWELVTDADRRHDAGV